MFMKNIQGQFIDALWALSAIVLFAIPVINIGSQYNDWNSNGGIQHLRVFCDIYAC